MKSFWKKISSCINTIIHNVILCIIAIMEKIIEYLKEISVNEYKKEIEENREKEFVSTVDKKIYKDTILKANERYYLMCMIENINMNNNCIEISLTELMKLFDCKKKSQVTTKLKDLEEKGAIKKFSFGGNEINKYMILKYVENSVRSEKIEVKDDKEHIKKDTSDTFATSIESLDIINKNISYYKEGININLRYIKEHLNKNNYKNI